MEDAQGLLIKAVQDVTPPPPMPQKSVPSTNAPIEQRPQVIAQQEEQPLVETPGTNIPGDQEPLAPGA